ncbi:hypothetical protein [Luteimonas sp. A482]
MGIVVNWRRIVALAVALLVSQFAIGFFEGVADSPDRARSQFLLGTLLSLLTAGPIFWFFAARQERRPYMHAGLGLVLMLALSIGLAAAVFTWLGGNFHLVLAAAEWLILSVALIAGTYIGSRSRGRSGGSAADA